MHGNNTIKSLYSYIYLKLAKMSYFSYYLLCFFFYKTREQEGGTGSAQRLEGGGRERGRKKVVAQIMYIHVSKCKNDKIKKYIIKKMKIKALLRENILYFTLFVHTDYTHMHIYIYIYIYIHL
jgi:hypothetical protein